MVQTPVKPHHIIRRAAGDRLFFFIIHLLLIVLTALVCYPLIYVVSASFSSPRAVSSGQVVFFPVEFSLEGYTALFRNKNIWTGYANTIFYTLVGTFINVSFTMVAAYPLSRRDLPYRGFFMFLFTFTMLFSGGMIPSYLLLMNLKLLNTRWAMLLPGAISAYNMIIARTFIQGIPAELLEAGEIDGCSYTRAFFRLILPLCKAVIAVLTLYYAVSHWNAYFNAMLYLNERKLFPLQIILREILISNTITAADIADSETALAREGMAELLKYALIIISSVPILLFYPFIQKYFVQGVMIGSIKG
ncbi:MAG: carbohydrate ABC transporter permease [Clostridia bacterium]